MLTAPHKTDWTDGAARRAAPWRMSMAGARLSGGMSAPMLGGAACHRSCRAGPLVRFVTVATLDAALATDGERYRRVLEVRGRWRGEPGYAVFAAWQIEAAAQEPAFADSRRALFLLRRQVLPGFAVDWLLQRLDQAGRYLVLGLYGDERGLRLCRDHPEIRRFTQGRPAASYTASDVTGLRFFRVRHSS
jgi:hypothetical protein